MKSSDTTTDVPEFKVVIPARYASTRFPGKVLAELAGKPMLGHVVDRAAESGATEIVIAVDDQRVADYCDSVNCNSMMTAVNHTNGTERIAEVAKKLGWSDDSIIVGLQCDEPATPAATIRQVASSLATFPDADMATLCTPITSKSDYMDPNRVKVVRDRSGFALYFSRAPIPWRRDQSAEDDDFPASWLHIGMYAYRASFLNRYVGCTETLEENEEKLEQLRALINGFRIHVSEVSELPAHGVDKPDDVAAAEQAVLQLKNENLSS